MTKWRRLGTGGSVSLGVAIAVLVGCQTPLAIKTDSENKTVLAGSTGAGVQNQGAEQVLTEGVLPAEVAPVDLAPAMLISAEKGGVYVSPDGLLTATIPPGALSEDAEVRFVALDTSKQKNTAQRVAGMRFQMDIGKAYLKPGSRIMVAARADARFVPELKSMYTDFTPERYSLKQDDKGNWNIEMPVEGPRVESIPYDFVPEDPFKNSRRGIMTEGVAPIDSKSAANFKRDSRIEAFCDYTPPPPPQAMYNVDSEVRWISDHDKDADYLGSIGFHGDLATGETGWADGSSVAGNPSKPTVRFGNLGARNIPTSTHWVTLTPPQAAVPQVSHWESVKGETAEDFVTFKTGAYRVQSTAVPIPRYMKTLAGSSAGLTDGVGAAAKFNSPFGVIVDQVGNLIVADRRNHCIRKITSDGTVTTLAGTGTAGTANGVGTAAQFNEPRGIAMDSNGNIYIVEHGAGGTVHSSHRIRKLSPSGQVTTFAGTGIGGFVDGPANVARFNFPTGIAIDSADNLFVVDYGNHCIRKVTPDGVVTTLSGSRWATGFEDGPGNTVGTDITITPASGVAKFYFPNGITIDNNGDLLVTDWNHCIRKVSPTTGYVTTLVGVPGAAGSTDGAPGTAKLNFPNGITKDSAGNLYVCDTANNRIRRIDTTTNEVTTLEAFDTDAGCETEAAALLSSPALIAVDGAGALYIADAGNNRIRKMVTAGASEACPTPTPIPTPTPRPTRTISKDGYAPYSIETNDGRYSAIKLPSGNWVDINDYQNVTTTVGTDTWTEVKFNLADGKVLQFENPDWWVVVKRTNGVATEAKQIDIQGAPKFRGIFEERADAFTVGTNQTVRRGHEWNGSCYCNYVVYYDNIVHDTAPQPVRGRSSANPGRANNIARNGFTIGIQATYNYPNPQGNQNNLSNAVTMTVGANNPVAQLRLTKNSPLLQMTMNSPSVPFATGSTLVLETVVDGVDRIYRWPGNDSNTLNADFFVRLKSDDPASFQVKRAYIENLSLSATQLTLTALEKITIQRNGVYPLNLTFEAQGAK